jgi:hypothetical protein
MSSNLAAPGRETQWPVVLAAGLALTVGAFGLGADNWRAGALVAVGGLLGVSLYHGMFGFTTTYRNAILYRDVAFTKAQLVMVGLASLLFVPTLAMGEAFGRPLVGAVAPVGLQVAVGSFLFGIGMQLAGGCGSGTLYALGGGSMRMIVALSTFCTGGFVASLNMDWWAAAPGWGSVSLLEQLGWQGAVSVQLVVLALLWFGLHRWAGDARQSSLWEGRIGWPRLMTGPWSPLLTAGLLAVLNWVTLVIAGHPWTITWAFTLWGAKAATGLGWDPATSPFWISGFPARAISRGVLQDITSLMDIGIVLGAMTAAGLAGRFAPSARIPTLSLAAAALGGALMGYGARIAYGCNIGAFFSGAASTSLHGWLWIVCAIPGTWLGIRLRPLFGLKN